MNETLQIVVIWMYDLQVQYLDTFLEHDILQQNND